MLGVITTILTVILVFICLLMSLVILMQRPKQEGLGAAFGGGIADKMLGSGTTDFLQRATVMMGVAFFVLSLTIATLMAYDRDADRKAGVEAVKDAALTNTGDTGGTPPAGNIDIQDEDDSTGTDPAANGAPPIDNPAPEVDVEPDAVEGGVEPAAEVDVEAAAEVDVEAAAEAVNPAEAADTPAPVETEATSPDNS